MEDYGLAMNRDGVLLLLTTTLSPLNPVKGDHHLEVGTLASISIKMAMVSSGKHQIRATEDLLYGDLELVWNCGHTAYFGPR